MNYSLVFDVVVALLLIVAIGSAVVLSRKLSALRTAETDMKKVLGEFMSATDRAKSGLDALNDHAHQSGAALQRQIGDARGLADDLAFLVEKGSSIADRLETHAKAPSTRVPAGSAPMAQRNGPGRTAQNPQTPQTPPAIGGNMPPATSAATPAGKKLLKSLQGIR